tara:strand:- start:141 stop:941 length:801 start_codon:yes stop_codon:yes gene_type:complete
MPNGSKKGQKRRSRKRRPKSNKNIFKLSVAAVVIVIIVIFLIALGLDPTIGAVVCMLALGAIFYLMATGQSKPRRSRRKPKKNESRDSEPQFYTALPSSLGLTEIPEEPPKPQVKLPPRPIRAARRRRDFITYPMAVGGGSYSDSYVQVDKDTVLRLRSEMTLESSPRLLPGTRIGSLPSSKIGAVMSQELKRSLESPEPQPAVVPVSEEASVIVEAAEAVPVVAVDAEAAPVVASEASPVEQAAVQAAVVQEEEEEEIEFDMEWD